MVQRREPLRDKGLDKKYDGSPTRVLDTTTAFDFRNYGGSLGKGSVDTQTPVSTNYVSTYQSGTGNMIGARYTATAPYGGFFAINAGPSVRSPNTTAKITLSVGGDIPTSKLTEWGGAVKVLGKYYTTPGDTQTITNYQTSTPFTVSKEVTTSEVFDISVSMSSPFATLEYSDTTTKQTFVTYGMYDTKPQLWAGIDGDATSVQGTHTLFIGFGSVKGLNWNARETAER